MDGRTTKILFAVCALAWAAIVLRTAFTTKGPEDFEITVSQAEIQAFAREQLDQLQAPSFAENTEYCGFIFEDAGGDLNASRTIRGHEDSCDIAFFDMPGMAPVASFHTHGGFSTDYDSEVPSIIDMESDIGGQLDGYIATPGGRFWHIDWRAREANLVCGPGCLTQDRNYRSCDALLPEEQYTISGLEERNNAPFARC